MEPAIQPNSTEFTTGELEIIRAHKRQS